jgi:diadenosine tetraphosphate (Ap4A) HIT family hydrolase
MCGGLWKIYYDGQDCQAVRILCKTWTCTYCGAKRRKALIALGIRGEPNTFITLTTSPATAQYPNEAARKLVKAWRKVVREVRKNPKNSQFEYLAVMEAQANGRPHLHILARSTWIDQAWLSSRMAKELKAPIVDIRRIENPQRAARYCAKYVGKAPQRFGKLKRYWTSKKWDINKRPRKGAKEWKECEEMQGIGPAAGMIKHVQQMGYFIIESNEDYIFASKTPP